MGWIGLMGVWLSGCATQNSQNIKKEDIEKELSATREQIAELRTLITSLNTKTESVETKLSSMNDKVDENRARVDNLLANSHNRTKAVGISAHPSATRGVQVETRPANATGENGFVNDASITSYRNARIVFEARQYPESVLAFTSFLERYADHALAGSAQYFIGEAYFRQKEYQLALREFQRVLTSYDRSSHLPETLKRMAEAADLLKKPEEAARYRQLLLALFPQSPAAAGESLSESVPRASASESKPASPNVISKNMATDSHEISSTAAGGAVDEPPPTAPSPSDSAGEDGHHDSPPSNHSESSGH